MLQVFRAQSIVTSNTYHDVIEDGFLAIEKGIIKDVGPWKKRPRAKSNLEDVSFGIISPSLFNMHTHLPMSLFRGIAEDQELETWLFKTILPLESKFLNPDFVKAGTELALCESIRNGVTYFCDMYLFEDSVAKVADRMGVRGTFCHAITGLESPDYKRWEDGLEAARKFIKPYKNHPRIKMGVGPHAVYTCNDQVLKASADFAKENDLGGMIHLAETKTELNNCKKEYGCTPAVQIEKSGLFDLKYLILAHSIWLEDKDFARLRRKNLTAALNVRSNAKLASGFPPIQRFKKENVRFALGTDGAASNNNLDIFEEIDLASKGYRLETGDLTGFPGHEVFDAATCKAAEAVGLGSSLGSLEPGKEADFIVIDTQSSHLSPMTRAYSHLIHSIRGSDVHSTYVGGKALMKNKKIMVADEKKILSKANQIWKKLKKSVESSK